MWKVFIPLFDVTFYMCNVYFLLFITKDILFYVLFNVQSSFTSEFFY